MSRLIDADKLIEEMRKWYWDKEKQKAAFDVEKVVHELQNLRMDIF